MSSPTSSIAPLPRRIMTGRWPAERDGQGPLLGVEDAEAQGDELLLDAGREEQAVQLVGGRATASSR